MRYIGEIGLVSSRFCNPVLDERKLTGGCEWSKWQSSAKGPKNDCEFKVDQSNEIQCYH